VNRSHPTVAISLRSRHRRDRQLRGSTSPGSAAAMARSLLYPSLPVALRSPTGELLSSLANWRAVNCRGKLSKEHVAMRTLALLTTATLCFACYGTTHSVAEVRYPEPLPAETSTGMFKPTFEPPRTTARRSDPSIASTAADDWNQGRPTRPAVQPSWRAPAAYPAPRINIEHDILRWTNVERLAVGLAPLLWSETLARAARAHSEEMARLNYFEHTSPTAATRSPLVRAMRAGLRGDRLFVAENIAMGTFRNDHARHIVKLWMDSPGHRENIMRKNLRYLGVGVSQSSRDLYATQLFSSTP